jgi:hypothetical protein
MPTPQDVADSPGYTEAFTVEVESKLRYLRKVLEEDAFQRKNIELLIHYYQNGGEVPPPGQVMWLLDGEFVDEIPEKVSEGSAAWAEAACGPRQLVGISINFPLSSFLHQRNRFRSSSQYSTQHVDPTRSYKLAWLY